MPAREIKFRAWDGLVMHYDYIVARPQACNVLTILTDEVFAKSQYGVREWKVMQYISYISKNNKQIYEDDLINCPFMDHAWGSSKRKIKYILCRVYWTGEQWSMRNLEPLGKFRFFPDWEECEVAGNIYQNPELLIGKEENDA